jgi:hypothetical protein
MVCLFSFRAQGLRSQGAVTSLTGALETGETSRLEAVKKAISEFSRWIENVSPTRERRSGAI